MEGKYSFDVDLPRTFLSFRSEAFLKEHEECFYPTDLCTVYAPFEQHIRTHKKKELENESYKNGVNHFSFTLQEILHQNVSPSEMFSLGGNEKMLQVLQKST